MKKKRFQLGGSFYEIPEGEISSFLQENPKAIEVKFYDIKGSQFNIPISDVDSFEIDMGLKKKDGGVPSPDGGEAGISVPPSGFEGLKPVKTKVSIKEREVAPPIDLEGDPIKAAASKVTDLPKLLERQQRATISTTGVEKPIEVAREVEKERKVERVETAKAKKLLDTTTKAFQQDAGLSAEFLMRAGKLSSPEQVNVLSKEQLIELADPNNETQRLAVNTLLDQKDINQAISSAKDLEEAAVLYAGAKDPQIARQIDITSLTVPSNLQEVLSGTGKRRMAPTQDIFAEATRGRMLYQMLTNPVAVSEIQKNPKLNQELKDAVPMLLEKYPDFGKMYLGQRISQKMEDMGTNNAILNIVTPEETDRAVEALVGEGKMSQREKQFYEQNLRGEGGLTDFGRKILGRQLYDTPGLVESTLGGAVQGVMALGRGSAELTGLRQGLLGESETVARDLAERDLRTNVSPKNTLNQISKFGGEFLGQSLSIGAGGKALNAIKAVKGIPLASGIVGGLQAYANYLPDARSKFPGDEIKQRGYATVLASLEGLTENIFRDSKVVDGLMGRMRPEVKKVIEDFSSKKISAEAARQTLQGQIKKTLLELPEAAKFYAKGVAENTAEEVAAQLGQQITSGVFENKSIDDWINGQELFDTARQALLGSAFVAGLSARADMAKNRGITAKMIYGMAENPEYWTYKIQEAAALDPDFAAEAEDKLSNLGYASRIFGEIQDSNMTEKQKIKYLMDALDAKVKTQQAQSITDPVLKKKLEGEVAAVQKEQADLLDNIDDGTIEGDFSDEILPEEKEAVVKVEGVEEVVPEAAPEVPAAPEITDTEYNEFIDKGIVAPERLNNIAQKVKNQEKLSEREQEIFADKTSDINKIIAGEVTPQVPAAPVEALKDVESTTKALQSEIDKGFKFTANFGLPFEQLKTPNQVSEAYHKAKAEGTNPVLVKAVEDLLVGEVVPQVPATAISQEIADLRAEEQAEYAAMDDPNDEVKRKEIYDKYDKLITPLLEKEKISKTQKKVYGKERKPEAIREIKINSEKVQYNGTDAIGSRERAESDKAAARNQAKEKVKNPNTNASLKAANSYNSSVGLPKITRHKYKPSDKAQQTEIAKIYPKLQDVNSPAYKETELEKNIYVAYKQKYPDIIEKYNIKNYKDLVKKSYAQLIQEVELQYQSLPVKVTFHEQGEGNYEDSREMLDDVHNFNHLWVYKGGDDHTELGSKTADENGLTANDKFRAVHDYFGHSIEGYEFGKNGEENAWIEHSKMFSPLAQWALSSETRGQNSFVNYSGINDAVLETIKTASALKKEGIKTGNQEMVDEANKLLSTVYDDFKFAEQKAIILPPKYTDYSRFHDIKISQIPQKLENAVQKQAAGKVPVQPEAGVGEEMAGGVPPTEPPKAPEEGEAEGEEREMTGISNEEAEKMRLAMALPLFERPEPETFEQLNDKANEEIRKGYDIGKLLDKLEKNIPPTSLEEVILAKYGATLADKFEKTKDEQALKDYERLTNITNKIGTLTARALNARKVLVPKEDTLADFFILEKEETGVDELTEEQKATVTKEYEEIKAAKEALEKKIEELQEENARILAGEVISEERKRAKKGKKTDKEFTEERKQIIQDIREKLKEAREQSKSTVVPYANELITIAPDVAKLVKNLVEQGVVKLEDIVNEIHESLKGDIEDLTKKDVRDLIAGEYTKKKKSRSQIAAQIVDLKNEAKLLVQLEKLEAGEIPKDPIKKVERNREIKKLRDRIKEHPISKAIEEKRKAETKVNNLQKELDNLRQKIVKERAVPVEDTPEVKELKEQIFEAKKNLGLIKSKAPKPEEVKTPEQKKVERLQKELEDLKKGITKRRSTPIENTPEIKKLKEQIKEEKERLGVTIKDEMASAKKRIAAQIAKLEKDIKEGNFDKKPEKREVPLDREGKELQRKLIGLKKEREIRRLKNEYEKRNKAEKVRDKLLEIANIPRSLMASTDFSAPLNQAIVATIAYPDLARKAAEQMIKATASQGAFDEWFDDLKSDPRYDLMKELKLRISDPNSPFLTAKEEAFMSGYAEQIPVVGKLVKASERAYVQYLNKLRVDLFNRFIDKFEEQGKTYQNNPRLYAATAQYINNITGSGKLPNIGGIDFEQFAPVFNTLLFSPRLMAARINMLNPYYFATLPTPLKIQYGKDMGSFLGMASLLLTLFALYGKTQGDDEEKITVETDPTSTDFARIKQGETRWDLSGGFQPYIRLFNQIGAGERKSAKTGLKQSLDGEGAFGLTYGDVVLSFLRSKLSPIPAMTVDFMQGRNVVGERVTLKDEIFSHVIPLSMQSIIEAAKEGGPSKIISAGLPAIFGIGVQTYGERPREVKQEINYRNREIELTKEQVNYFQDTYNSLSTKNLEKLKNTKEYKGVSRETQVEMEKYVQKAAMQKAEKMLTTKYSKEFLKSPVIKKEPKEERAKESIKRQF